MYHECSHQSRPCLPIFYISYFIIYFLYIFVILCHIEFSSSSYCTTLMNTLKELRVLYFIFVSHHSKGLPAVLFIITFGGVILLSFFGVRSPSAEEAVSVLRWRCCQYHIRWRCCRYHTSCIFSSCLCISVSVL